MAAGWSRTERPRTCESEAGAMAYCIGSGWSRWPSDQRLGNRRCKSRLVFPGNLLPELDWAICPIEDNGEAHILQVAMGDTGLHNRAVVRSRLHLEFLLDFMSLGQLHIPELRRHCQTVISRHENPPLGHHQRAYNRTEPRGTKRSLPDLNLPIVLGSGAPQQEAPLLHLPF